MIGLALLQLLHSAHAAAPDPTTLVQAALNAAGDAGADTAEGTSTQSVRLLLLLTGMTFLPAMAIAMTPFVRFIIVFSLLRQALGLNQTPPNQVIVGLSLFLTALVMQPVLDQVWQLGLAPFLDGSLAPGDAIGHMMAPMREFMLANTRREDMAAVLEIGRLPRPENVSDLPSAAVASAYLLSELKTAFITVIYVLIPFLVIDLVISAVLLGMGMMMMPPVVVSLPIKLLVFVLMDGWTLLIHNLSNGIVR